MIERNKKKDEYIKYNFDDSLHPIRYIFRFL